MDIIFDISGEQLPEEHKYNRYNRIEGLRFSEKPANEIGRFLKIAEGKLPRANQATENAALFYLWTSKVFDKSKDMAGYSPKHVAKEFEYFSIAVIA